MQRPLRTLLSQSPVITTAAAVVAIVGLCFILGIQATPLLQCLMIAGLVGVSWSLLHKRPHIPSNLALLEQPFALACDEELFTRYRLLIDSLLKISQSRDPIFRVLSLESLDETVRRVDALANGLLMFEGTETWRIVYERLLRSAGLYRYRSVAWIQSAAYWQDEPGRKSMAVNIELQSTGQVSIERIAIIADHLWPPHDVWPVESLRQWIHEQYACGIQISFVRESALTAEPDLLADIGIYGSRAVGTQELDEHARTIRFRLEFDFDSVAEADGRWNRLAVYSESFAGYLDRYEIDR